MRQIERMLEIFSTFVAGKGERYAIKIDKNGDDSYYSKDRRIVIGLKSALEKLKEEVLAIGKALVSHEVGHYRFTEWIDDKSLPFAVLNVLEDARIEQKMIEETIPKLKDYFKQLHAFSFQTVYLNNEKDDLFINPVNLLILQRWSIYGINTLGKVESRKHLLETLVKRNYSDRTADELLDDCKKAVQQSISASSTKEVVEIGKRFYQKWKKLFDSYFDGQPIVGQGGLTTAIELSDEEVSAEEMDRRQKEIDRRQKEIEKGEEEGKVEKSLPDSSLFLHPEYNEEVEDFFSSTPWEWDEDLIREIRNRLKRWRVRSKTTIREYSLTSGRRVSPRRIAQKKLEILKRDKEIVKESSTPNLLFVIDGSGSMGNGGEKYTPYYYASHLARALKEEVGADVVVTNSYIEKPIWVTTQMDKLRYYNYPHGEGLRIVKPFLSRYDYVVFFTDGFVCEEDYRFLKENRNKFVVVYSTGDNPSYSRSELEKLRKGVEEIFKKFTHRYVVTDDIVNTAQELALLLRRL